MRVVKYDFMNPKLDIVEDRIQYTVYKSSVTVCRYLQDVAECVYNADRSK